MKVQLQPALVLRPVQVSGLRRAVAATARAGGCRASDRCLLAAGSWQPQRAALLSGFHLSSDLCYLSPTRLLSTRSSPELAEGSSSQAVI